MAIPLMIAAQRLLRFSPAHQPALANPHGYQPGGRHSIVSAGLALTITGGVGAALVLALVAPEVLRIDRGVLVGRLITDPPAPPPPPPDKRVEPQTPAHSEFTLPRPPLAPPTGDAPTGEVTFLPPPDPGPTIGSDPGGSGVIDPPLPPVNTPVLRRAERDQRFIAGFQPAYPAAMQRAGTEGACTVSVSITANGRVSAVRNGSCPNADFFRATQRQAVNRWRFTPATRDGVAVEATLNQTVRFEIND